MARRTITLGLAGAGLAAALFLFMRRTEAAQRTLDLDTGEVFEGEYGAGTYSLDAAKNEAGIFEGILSMSEPELFEAMGNQNVRAFLEMLGKFEGGTQGYNALFGGGRFESFLDHPRTLVRASGYSSTAAGKYQILERTWDDVRDTIGATDFSPYWQDVAAVYLIRRRGALADVMEGHFDAAIAKLGKEWASLPGSPYGQPVRTLADARDVYAAGGGTFA